MLVNATSSAWRNAVKRRCLEGRYAYADVGPGFAYGPF